MPVVGVDETSGRRAAHGRARSRRAAQRALIDADESAAVALRVAGLPLVRRAHGRLPRPPRPRDDPDLRRPRRPRRGSAVGADELMRVPCDLDLGRRGGPRRGRAPVRRAGAPPARRAGGRRHRARHLARAARGPRRARVEVDRRLELDVRLPAPRLLPAALVAPDARIVVTAVCGARALAEGKPPMGIACAQQDVARVYPLPDDPERCLDDFLEHAAEHARRVGEQLGRQEQSVRRFLELSGEGFDGDRLTCGASCAAACAAPTSSPPLRHSSSSWASRSCSRAG